MLGFDLPEEQQALVETARKFARERIAPVAAACDHEERFPDDVFREAWTLGLLNCEVAEASGGLGLGCVEHALILEELHWGCAGISTSLACNALAATPLLVAGSEEQKRRATPGGGRYNALVALFEPLIDALERGGVRYVIVGGVATVLHGFARLTADVDLIVDLDPVEARKAITALVGLGLRPRAPVDPFAFVDPEARSLWIRDKGMRVFSMYDPGNPMREVDLFVENPIPFDDLWRRAEAVQLSSTIARVAAIPDLIALKRLANRPQDRTDIEALEAIAQRRAGGTDDA